MPTSKWIEDFLRGLIRDGDLTVILPGGRRWEFGDRTGPAIVIALKDLAVVPAIAAAPYLGLGEAYMDGRLTLQQGTIRDLLELGSRNANAQASRSRPHRLAQWWKNVREQAINRAAARANVAHHYDLSFDLYRRFLDEDMQYSCAFFERPDIGLDEAQLAKKRHIAAKLNLSPDQRILDIGCGWGGMAVSLAAWSGARVDGVTLSAEQLSVAQRRAATAGLADRVTFSLTDYRDVAGTYDRIVSVGMFEHVGAKHYQAFFDAVARLLADDGVAVLHSVGSARPPAPTDPFTTKHIFPGAHVPSLSEVLPAVERAGLWVTDLEIQRLHYARTLEVWMERFTARRAEIVELYDERFCRMWECYLAGAEMGFRYGGHMIFQMQLTRTVNALPITRTYMVEDEADLARREGQSAWRAKKGAAQGA